MSSDKSFYNKSLKSRTTYVLWLCLFIVGVVAVQILKLRHYSGSTASGWMIVVLVILFGTYYLLIHRRFFNLAFDDLNNKISLKTMSVVNGIEERNFNYSDISYKIVNDPPASADAAKVSIDIYRKRKKLIRLNRRSIGESNFDNILSELQKLNIKN